MNSILKLLLAAFLFTSGYWAHSYLHTCPLPEPEVVTKVEYRDRVETVVQYVPKAADEKTDIDMLLGRPELNVKVNGKDFTVAKADDEQYVFDKNKLTLNQSSRADLNITVPVVDRTRRWGVGIGLHDRKAMYFAKAPLKRNVGLWVAANSDDAAGGIVFEF